MSKWKELQEELGDGYEFKCLLSEKEVFLLQKQNPVEFDVKTVAYLTVGCVKLEASLYKQGDKIKLGYDMFVKDRPDAAEWIIYDTLICPVSLEEEKMFMVLDQKVQENDLSYTACNFEVLDGKIVKPEMKDETAMMQM